jgi:FkbH-like protein
MNKQKIIDTINRLAFDQDYGTYLAVANVLDAAAGPEESGLPPLRVAVLRNFTLDSLLPVIKGEIVRAGFHPFIYQGDFDVIAPEVLNPASALYGFQPDFIILAQWLETLAPNLVTRFISLSGAQVTEEINRILDSLEQTIAGLRQYTQAPILLNNFPLPIYTTLGILDAQVDDSQTQAILSINRGLLVRAREWRDTYLVDYFGLLARTGSALGLDERYWQMGRAPLGRHALVPFGQEYGKFFRALRGKTRKCLVLDCDNTLWGGVIGEDGLANIKLGTTYPGSCYQAFQREILNLHDRGVILTLCSKNNEADALDVFRQHPETVLREEHFATWQINWDDKVTNIKRLAQSLNIGLDSLVFVDDSEFECDLVRDQLPQVAVVQLPADPSAFTSALSAGAFFDSLTFSDEDRERNQMYRGETQRKEVFETAGSLEDYLTGLQMVAEIGTVSDVSIPRVAQLTQKTNQFNVTTRRYSEGEIRAFSESASADVFSVRLRDRISDLGLIGVAIVKYSGCQAEIDSFLLSCRAIGRGVEDALLVHLLNQAQSRGCTQILATFIPTNKNTPAADFYQRHGFKLSAETLLESELKLSLAQEVFLTPGWITVQSAIQGA